MCLLKVSDASHFICSSLVMKIEDTWKNAAVGEFILLILFCTWSICWYWTWLKFMSGVLQCWICNTQWLSSVVIFAFQKKLHAVIVSQRNFDSWLGSESDSGCDCNWKNRCAFSTGNENLIAYCHCNSLLTSYVSSWPTNSSVLISSGGWREVSSPGGEMSFEPSTV